MCVSHMIPFTNVVISLLSGGFDYICTIILEEVSYGFFGIYHNKKMIDLFVYISKIDYPGNPERIINSIALAIRPSFPIW